MAGYRSRSFFFLFAGQFVSSESGQLPDGLIAQLEELAVHRYRKGHDSRLRCEALLKFEGYRCEDTSLFLYCLPTVTYHRQQSNCKVNERLAF